jgi:hypothetical protein
MANKLFFLCILINLVFVYSNSYPQNFLLTDCQHIQAGDRYHITDNVTGGLFKPYNTTQNGAPDSASFRILLVFVQFADEPVDCDYWPKGQAPKYMNELLAENKKTNGNYWERYNQNTEMLSAWYQEVSKGKMHVTGKAYYIPLTYDANYYLSYSSDEEVRMRNMNNEIFDKLTQAGVQWQDYDNWSGSDGNFYYRGDNYVDMIIKVHRHTVVNWLFPGNNAGYAHLGFNPLDGIDISVGNGKYINDGFYKSNCSGVTVVGTSHGPASKDWVFNIAKHEIGHYWFGASHTSPGVGIMGGGEIYLGAWESLKLGYLTSTTINFNSGSYNLNDITSRNSNGEILQVPIDGSSEYFLITNRRQVSYFDKTMLGDTAKDDWQRVLDPNVDYGKGVYIYHHTQGMTFQSANDMECADGLWNWTYTGTTTPDWNDQQIMDVYERTSLPSIIPNDDGWAGLFNKDGRTMGLGISYYGDDFYAWFGRGHRHTPLTNEAIDRCYSNDTALWTKRELMGDRWDAWNIGYNQVFSPYSNPNTKDWNNNNTGIFIYYHSFDPTTNEAQISFYKVDAAHTEDSILAVTPPSRPMGLTISFTDCDSNGARYPVLTWRHNQEPDMKSPLMAPRDFRRYKIFRATGDLEHVPVEYSEIADRFLIFVNNSTPAEFIDNTIYLNCNSQDEQFYNIRYKIKAVDNMNMASVYSDFVSTQTLKIGIGGNNFKYLNNPPKSFMISQNYPNPFNPVTNIRYDLPNDVRVLIKIYDLLGREIKTLVNEFKKAGSYIISFNGAELASGVYFYRIAAGNFVSVKRMVLLK